MNIVKKSFPDHVEVYDEDESMTYPKCIIAYTKEYIINNHVMGVSDYDTIYRTVKHEELGIQYTTHHMVKTNWKIVDPDAVVYVHGYKGDSGLVALEELDSYSMTALKGCTDIYTSDAWDEVGYSSTNDYTVRVWNDDCGIVQLTEKDDESCDEYTVLTVEDIPEYTENTTENTTEEPEKLSPEADELALYADNTSEIYFHYTLPTMKNLHRKMLNGCFDFQKGVKAYEYITEAAAKHYNRWNGSGRWYDLFPKQTRREAAEHLLRCHYDQIEKGDY